MKLIMENWKRYLAEQNTNRFFVINTPKSTGGAVLDGNMMRRLAVELNIPFVTTMAGARMEVEAIKEALDGIPEPRLLEIKSLN